MTNFERGIKVGNMEGRNIGYMPTLEHQNINLLLYEIERIFNTVSFEKYQRLHENES